MSKTVLYSMSFGVLVTMPDGADTDVDDWDTPDLQINGIKADRVELVDVFVVEENEND